MREQGVLKQSFVGKRVSSLGFQRISLCRTLQSEVQQAVILYILLYQVGCMAFVYVLRRTCRRTYSGAHIG